MKWIFLAVKRTVKVVLGFIFLGRSLVGKYRVWNYDEELSNVPEDRIDKKDVEAVDFEHAAEIVAEEFYDGGDPFDKISLVVVDEDNKREIVDVFVDFSPEFSGKVRQDFSSSNKEEN